MRPTATDAPGLPPEAVPFFREFLLEVARRVPGPLGPPLRLPSGPLREPRECAEAEDALLRWLETLQDSLGQQLEELEDVFASLLDAMERLDNRIHRAVHHTRRWVEEEVTFSRTVREALGKLGTPSGDRSHGDPPREIVGRVLQLIGAKERSDQREALELSAQFDAAETDLGRLRAQISRVERRTRELRDQTLRDGLTGLLNRRAWERLLLEEVARAQRHARPVSVALWDVDRFRQWNEKHGHRVGDRVLQLLADRVSSLLRRSDLLARYGGDRFAVILPNTDAPRAAIAGEKIRAAIRADPVPTPAGDQNLTVSVGVACVSPGDTSEALFETAFRALCQAKTGGGDRMEVAERCP